jgi:hypothetical protein
VSSHNRGSPSTVRPDTVSSRKIEADRRGVSHVKHLLDNFLQVMNQVGDDAEENYEKALSELRQRPDEAIIEIVRSEKACDDLDYPTRWALLYTATEIKHPSSLPFLSDVVLTPIPPEHSKNPHSFSTVAQETILRTTAIDGIRYLAEQGNEEALKKLYEFIKLPSISMRRASIQAIFSARKDKETRDRLAALLPSEQQFLLDIKPTDVRNVPQVKNPEVHLTESAKTREKNKQPMLPGGADTSEKISEDSSKNKDGPKLKQ